MEERNESLVEYSFFPSAISDSDSESFSWIWNGTNSNSSISIPSIFPANDSDSESYGSSGSNETSPEFSHNSNSIVSFFPPAWSPTDSPENYEIIIRNPSTTITSSFSHFFPQPNGPTRSFSIPLIFPPTISETETDDSCSESNQSPRVQFSDSIVSLFPPVGSQSDNSSSQNYEIIIPNNPSLSTRPKSNNSSKSVPQLSSSYVSVKSGPVRSETSAYSDTSNTEKSNGHNRVKSSPLRRLLDPILTYEVSNSFHSAETILLSKESLDSFCSRPTSGSDTLQNEKHEASTTQAFLQLTVKNGLPLFSFAVKNDKMIFAATMKNLTSSGKDDSDRYYKLYFVNEIKKKSGGWISQGSKRPSHGCDYYVVGQMKVSSSSNNQFLVRESVLSGVELRQADQEPLEIVTNKELAAVVVKIPNENKSHDGTENDKDFMEKLCIKCLPEDRCSCNYKETEDSDSIVVILPGGAHGSPSKGEPSRLMDRWKSGGSCDCEGWDVGCKLCVLSNQNQGTKIPKISKDCPIPDHIELFLQGGSQQASPFFSLTELKDGLFSIEFNSSISLLQSFFICVAVLSCKRPFNLLDMSEAKVFKEPILNENDGSQRRASAKYAPNPSSSPVGRI